MCICYQEEVYWQPNIHEFPFPPWNGVDEFRARRTCGASILCQASQRHRGMTLIFMLHLFDYPVYLVFVVNVEHNITMCTIRRENQANL